MSTQPCVPAKVFSSYLQSLQLTDIELDTLARDAGWLERSPRKFCAADLLSVLCLRSVNSSASFNDLSRDLALLIDGPGPSKQAVAKRVNEPFSKLLELLLAKLIGIKLKLGSSVQSPEFFQQFDRVLLQDSTILALPKWLFETFSGVSNGHQKTCNARIQAVYDLKSMSFVYFEICSYTKNDLKAAPELELKNRDMSLRDRGYLSNSEVARHRAAGADCIYRHKTAHRYRDPETGQIIDLLAELRRYDRLDRIVQLTDSEESKVRLIAERVDQATAEARRRKAKKEMRGHKPSAEVLALMDWTIFITTLDLAWGDFSSLLRLYGLRWQIEMLFKSWKSQLRFDEIHHVSEIELRVILTMRLLLITEGTNVLYRLCYQAIRELYERDLSLQQFLKVLTHHPELLASIYQALAQPLEPGLWQWEFLERYCCYEKRKRKNIYDKIRDASQS